MNGCALLLNGVPGITEDVDKIGIGIGSGLSADWEYVGGIVVSIILSAA